MSQNQMKKYFKFRLCFQTFFPPKIVTSDDISIKLHSFEILWFFHEIFTSHIFVILLRNLSVFKTPTDITRKQAIEISEIINAFGYVITVRGIILEL